MEDPEFGWLRHDAYKRPLRHGSSLEGRTSELNRFTAIRYERA